MLHRVEDNGGQWVEISGFGPVSTAFTVPIGPGSFGRVISVRWSFRN